MVGHGAVALDVGGVVYYDEPFELAWLQGWYDRLRADDLSISLGAFLDAVERFYLDDDPGDEVRESAAAWSWVRVRRAWGELAQPIPGAVAAARSLARRTPAIVVANQPPECAAVLERWGISTMCAAVLLDSLVGRSKPDPALLRLALPHAGPPERLLVVGNRVDHDVRPALALGCPVAFVLPDTGARPPAGTHPDLARVHRRCRAARTAAPAQDERVRVVASLAELDSLLDTTDDPSVTGLSWFRQ